MDEFEDLEREFAGAPPAISKRGIHSLGQKLPGITREVETFFQNINQNISIPGMEELNRKTVTSGGPNWNKITPAVLGGGLFTIVVIFFDVMAFVSLEMSLQLLFVGVMLLPFNLFAIIPLGIGIMEYLDPMEDLEQIMVRTFYHAEKGLLMIVRNVYDIKNDSLRTPSLVSFTYISEKHYIRIYRRKPYTPSFDENTAPIVGGRRVCICVDEKNSSTYSVLYSCDFSHKKTSRQWAKYYAELLDVPFVGEMKVERMPWNPLSSA